MSAEIRGLAVLVAFVAALLLCAFTAGRESVQIHPHLTTIIRDCR